MQGGSRSLDESIKVGPWGGDCGTDWSFKAEGGITKIVLLHGSGAIYSISFKSDNGSGKVESNKFGSNVSGQTDKINLDWPREFLTSISGTHDCCQPFGPFVIKSLRFCTNLTKYGPFGLETGTSFSFPMEDGVIVGFHGRASVFIDAIGVYVKPLVTSQEYQMKQEIANQNMINSISLASNIIENHDFSGGLKSWNPNCECSKGFVVSTESSYPEGSAKSGSNYAVVTSRTEWWQGLEQDITCRVIPGFTYTASACVGVWGPLHGSVNVMATLKLEYQHSATRFKKWKGPAK